MATTNMRNGVDVDRLGELVQRIQADPTQGILKFETRSRWERGLRTHSEASYFWLGGERDTTRKQPHAVDADMPTSLGGGDSAPTAIELVLAALGSSLALGYAAQAAMRGVTLESLELTLQGDLDMRMVLGLTDRVHSGLQLIRIKGQARCDASDEVLKEIKEAVERSSVVWNTLSHPVKIISTLSHA